MTKSNKTMYLEFLRIIACLFVLYNHSCGVVITITASDFTKSRVAALLIFYLCKTAVPLFIMIAGANLLCKQDTPQKYIKRIVRTFMLLIVFSVFYHIYYNGTFSIEKFFYDFYMEYSSPELWYLYLYISILLLLPILRCLHLERKHYLYLLVLYCIGSGLLPFLSFYLKFPLSEAHIFSFIPSGTVILLLLGDFMEHKLTQNDYTIKRMLLAWTTFGLSLAFSLAHSIYQLSTIGDVNNAFVYNKCYFTPTLLLSLSIFYLAKYYSYKKIPNFVSSLIIRIGGCTLGIYLLGDFLRMQFDFISDFFKARTSELISVLLFDISVFLIGFLITYLYQFLKTAICHLIRKTSTNKI